MTKIDKSDPLTKTQIKLLQQVCGQFLYYARAVVLKYKRLYKVVELDELLNV